MPQIRGCERDLLEVRTFVSLLSQSQFVSSSFMENCPLVFVGIGEVLWDLLPGGRQFGGRRRTLRIMPRHWESMPRL